MYDMVQVYLQPKIFGESLRERTQDNKKSIQFQYNLESTSSLFTSIMAYP